MSALKHGRDFVSISPHNDAEIFSRNTHSEIEVEDTLASSQSAFQSWRRIPFSHRQNILAGLATRLREDKEYAAQMISTEMGKTLKEAYSEIEKCAVLVDYYTTLPDAKYAESVWDQDTMIATRRQLPLGCILGIMPWNFPFWQVFRFALPTLLSGNTVLLKHAPNVSQCNALIAQYMDECEKGIYKDLYIDQESTAYLIADSRVRGVSLTGSNAAGAAVAGIANKYGKPIVLELGGNDASIVFEDTHSLENALRKTIQSRCINRGQTCISTKRALIQASIWDKALAMLPCYFAQVWKDYTTEEGTAPLARLDLAQKVKQQREALRSLGAQCIWECTPDMEDAWTVNPSIWIQGNSPYDEEIFGPVLLLSKFENMQDALVQCNATDFGLGAALWTTNPDCITLFQEECEVGNLSIERPVSSHPAIPFGGVKASGRGVELGEQALYTFTRSLSVVR